MNDCWEISVRIAGNTRFPCLTVVINKGYKVQQYYQEDEQGSFDEFFVASRGSSRVNADSPEELLGLVCLIEEKGKSWKQLSSDDLKAVEELDEKAITLDQDGEEVS